MRKNPGAWALLCLLISNRSGLKPRELESAFQVGKEDGQIWCSWVNGKRTARDLSQEKVLLVALKKGWLDNLPDRLRDDIVSGTTSVEVAGLAIHDSRLPAFLPLPPDYHIPRPTRALANRAAALLLRDQQNPTSKEAKLRLADKDWWEAVQAVEIMLKTESNQSALATKKLAVVR